MYRIIRIAFLLLAWLPAELSMAAGGKAAMGPSRSGPSRSGPSVSVLAIRATKGGNQISKELRPLARALKKSFNFTGYSLANKTAKSVAGDKATAFDLVAGYRATITAAGLENGKIKLRIVVLKRKNKAYVKKLATTVALRPRKYQLLGGWPLAGGDVLIVAVSAR